MAKPLRRAALIIFAACLIGIASATADAQGSDDLDTLNQQAVELYRAGKYAEATEIARHALAVAERQFGSGDARVGTTLNNLALMYDDQGRYAEDEPLYKRALAITEKALGRDHPPSQPP